MHGPFRDQLDSAFGRAWRAMERFGVVQIRQAPAVATSEDGEAQRGDEAPRADGDVARGRARDERCVLRDRHGGCRWRWPAAPAAMGSFYRVVPCAQPHWTVVAVMTTEGVRFHAAVWLFLAAAPN